VWPPATSQHSPANSQQQLCVAFAERKPHGNASSCEEQAAESRRRMPQNWITGRMRDVWLWEEKYRNPKVKIPDYSFSCHIIEEFFSKGLYFLFRLRCTQCRSCSCSLPVHILLLKPTIFIILNILLLIFIFSLSIYKPM